MCNSFLFTSNLKTKLYNDIHRLLWWCHVVREGRYVTTAVTGTMSQEQLESECLEAFKQGNKRDAERLLLQIRQPATVRTGCSWCNRQTVYCILSTESISADLAVVHELASTTCQLVLRKCTHTHTQSQFTHTHCTHTHTEKACRQHNSHNNYM